MADQFDTALNIVVSVPGAETAAAALNQDAAAIDNVTAAGRAGAGATAAAAGELYYQKLIAENTSALGLKAAVTRDTADAEETAAEKTDDLGLANQRGATHASSAFFAFRALSDLMQGRFFFAVDEGARSLRGMGALLESAPWLPYAAGAALAGAAVYEAFKKATEATRENTKEQAENDKQMEKTLARWNELPGFIAAADEMIKKFGEMEKAADAATRRLDALRESRDKLEDARTAEKLAALDLAEEKQKEKDVMAGATPEAQKRHALDFARERSGVTEERDQEKLQTDFDAATKKLTDLQNQLGALMDTTAAANAHEDEGATNAAKIANENAAANARDDAESQRRIARARYYAGPGRGDTAYLPEDQEIQSRPAQTIDEENAKIAARKARQQTLDNQAENAAAMARARDEENIEKENPQLKDLRNQIAIANNEIAALQAKSGETDRKSDTARRKQNDEEDDIDRAEGAASQARSFGRELGGDARAALNEPNTKPQAELLKSIAEQSDKLAQAGSAEDAARLTEAFQKYHDAVMGDRAKFVKEILDRLDQLSSQFESHTASARGG